MFLIGDTSLLNLELKIIRKVLAVKLKQVLPVLISRGQTAFINWGFIGESERLIPEVIEAIDIENLSGYLISVGFEKTFDSMNYAFVIAALKKYGFGPNFIYWIEILLKNQDLCVINGGHTTKQTQKRSLSRGFNISMSFYPWIVNIFHYK